MARKFTKLFLGNIVYAIGRRIFRKIASIFTLPKPTLVIDGDEMIIGDASGLATGVEIYANGELVKRFRTGASYSLYINSELGDSAFKAYSERVKIDFAPTAEDDYDFDARTLASAVGDGSTVTASSYWVWSTANGYAKAVEVELTQDSAVTIKYGYKA